MRAGIRLWPALHFRGKDYNITNRNFTLYNVYFVQASVRLPKEIIGSVLNVNHAVEFVIFSPWRYTTHSGCVILQPS